MESHFKALGKRSRCHGVGEALEMENEAPIKFVLVESCNDRISLRFPTNHSQDFQAHKL